MARLGLSTPWDRYYSEVRELFKYDPEVHVVYDDESKELKLYVNNEDKADALTQLLPSTKSFGGVVLNITVVPANEINMVKATEDKAALFEKVFKGNPIVSYIKTFDYPLNFTYIVFVNEVVHYFEDNVGDINGNCNTLYQNIADDVFADVTHVGIFFCTDVPDDECGCMSLGAPVAEYP